MPSSIPIETFAFVLTGGKTRGCEKGTGVGVGVGVPIGVEVFGAPRKRTPKAAKAAAKMSTSKALVLISTDHEHFSPISGHQVSAPEWVEAAALAELWVRG